jgi:predicted dehydrogenase
MDYKLGVVGLGHWFNRLNEGIKKIGGLTLVKAVGTKPYEEKLQLLSSFNISKENYYLSDAKGHVPDAFYDNLDVVHISDPNKFHAYQTIEALSKGKYVITEKSFAVNKREFNKISKFISENNYQDKAYLHLHYMHKQPTLALKKLLPGLVNEYGKIKNVRATFFEKDNGEDAKRTWLLAPENGGIFMDWVHPFEILYYATESNFESIQDLSIYAVNPSYDSVNPTGVKAIVKLKGKNYLKDAMATISVAKGTQSEFACKSLRIEFESGVYAILVYVGSEKEFISEERGTLEIAKSKDNKKKTIMLASLLSGPNSSEIFVEEILALCNGKSTTLSFKDISKIFRPQWQYQKMVKSKELINDESAIGNFLKDGVEGMRSGTSE